MMAISSAVSAIPPSVGQLSSMRKPSVVAEASSAAQQQSPAGSQKTAEVQPQAVDRKARIEQAQESKRVQIEQQQINALSARDREVRAHEQAHVAAGGQYAGAAQYQFERGPNGVNYAVSGEVSISVGKEATPEETLQKAQIVRRAALAPAEPSPQDRRVAAQATRMESEARQEIAQARIEDSKLQAEEQKSATQKDEEGRDQTAEQSGIRDERNQNMVARQRGIIENSYNTITSRSSVIQTVA